MIGGGRIPRIKNTKRILLSSFPNYLEYDANHVNVILTTLCYDLSKVTDSCHRSRHYFQRNLDAYFPFRLADVSSRRLKLFCVVVPQRARSTRFLHEASCRSTHIFERSTFYPLDFRQLCGAPIPLIRLRPRRRCCARTRTQSHATASQTCRISRRTR